MGDKFLAHIERCKVLLHVIDISENNLLDSYKIIRNEIIKYGKNLMKKNELIALSKADLIPNEKKELLKIIENEIGKKPLVFSNITGEGLENLVSVLFKFCKDKDD